MASIWPAAGAIGARGLFYERGDQVRDALNYLMASRGAIFAAGEVRWQVYFDQYKYDDRFRLLRRRTGYRCQMTGDSVGTDLRWQRESRIGELTLAWRSAATATAQDPRPVSEVVYSPATAIPITSLFARAVEDLTALPHMAAHLDVSRNFGASLSPRLALVYRASAKTTWKAVYGRPFRNPSASNVTTPMARSVSGKPRLRPETAQTLSFRANIEFFGLGDRLLARYQLKNTIRAAFLEDAVSVRNSGQHPLRAFVGSREGRKY